ncbi:hypothetical protein IW492_12975 [Enterococcus sp. BWB1-3]|uniref:hypothetical protein n=1 Tax=unclassified Enterococcus TaxID=2608891 RepID=UPI001921D4DD|nr:MULTISPECIES: hypothetical protein [unclassified Enterococcus]MBL1230146.1 hypothetical protein [Enterococcus sp. BWB1-3]MCB5955586.1 hypothetical protein [Enterococcus sp. CWB-B31]
MVIQSIIAIISTIIFLELQIKLSLVGKKELYNRTPSWINRKKWRVKIFKLLLILRGEREGQRLMMEKHKIQEIMEQTNNRVKQYESHRHRR